jgi:hypothetical protein
MRSNANSTAPRRGSLRSAWEPTSRQALVPAPRCPSHKPAEAVAAVRPRTLAMPVWLQHAALRREMRATEPEGVLRAVRAGAVASGSAARRRGFGACGGRWAWRARRARPGLAARAAHHMLLPAAPYALWCRDAAESPEASKSDEKDGVGCCAASRDRCCSVRPVGDLPHGGWLAGRAEPPLLRCTLSVPAMGCSRCSRRLSCASVGSTASQHRSV